MRNKTRLGAERVNQLLINLNKHDHSLLQRVSLTHTKHEIYPKFHSREENILFKQGIENVIGDCHEILLYLWKVGTGEIIANFWGLNDPSRLLSVKEC